MLVLLASVLSAAHLAVVLPADTVPPAPPVLPAATAVRASTPSDSVHPAGPALPVALGLAPEGALPATESAWGPGVVLPAVRFPRGSPGAAPALADTAPRGSRRPMAVELPDSYYSRLTIHRIGAFAMFPLFGAEYVLGQKLINSTNRPHSLKVAHGIVAGALGVVFLSNTVTGVWNLWTARHVKQGRARRIVHSVIMLASDAGFVWAAASAGGAKRELTRAQTHRNIAIGSMALSTVGAVMMWLWKK